MIQRTSDGDRDSGQWREVDNAGGLPFVAALASRDDASIAARRLRSYRAMKALEGDHVIDVGCGVGTAAMELAAIVGTSGRVVGIDNSEAMVEAARSRAAELNLTVEFKVGDAYKLDFPDDTFNASRAQLLFIHLQDPASALREMIRITRPGGQVIIYEPDNDTLTLDAVDRELTRRIVQARSDSFQNGLMGRQLPRLMREAGLQSVIADPVVATWTDLATFETNFILNLDRARRSAIEAGAISEPEAARWWSELHERDRTGHFFATLTTFIVSGQKARSENLS